VTALNRGLTGSAPAHVKVVTADRFGPLPELSADLVLDTWSGTTGFFDSSTAAAVGTGLRSRSLLETARDTWSWIQADGGPTPPSHRPRLPTELESALLNR
jgi:hypothetical protein